MKVKDCEELQKEDEVTLVSLVEFPDKYPTWGWCVQIVFDKMTMCPDSLAPEERPDDPQPRHHRLHHRPPVSGVTTIKRLPTHPCYHSFQFHFYPVSGSLSLSPALSLSDPFQVHFHFPGSLLPGLRHLGAAHLKAGGGGWRWILLPGGWELWAVSQQSFKSYISALCEYALHCGTADCLQFRIWRKFTSQAIATPRRKAQVVLEVEETQAEIVGPAELFLRPGSKLELHCRVPLGRAGPDDHFRWTGSPLMRATATFQEDCSVALVPGSATDWPWRWSGEGVGHSSPPWIRPPGNLLGL